MHLQAEEQTKLQFASQEDPDKPYRCNHQGCTNAYETLHRLNSHIDIRRHGPKRSQNGKYLLDGISPY